jgi:hypothetical protein
MTEPSNAGLVREADSLPLSRSRMFADPGPYTDVAALIGLPDLRRERPVQPFHFPSLE